MQQMMDAYKRTKEQKNKRTKEQKNKRTKEQKNKRTVKKILLNICSLTDLCQTNLIQ
jgi:hypothetical protein